jgi:hypothetical protein
MLVKVFVQQLSDNSLWDILVSFNSIFAPIMVVLGEIEFGRDGRIVTYRYNDINTAIYGIRNLSLKKLVRGYKL